MLSVAPSPILTFEKVLRAFGTGGFTYADVVVQLERLLAIGASPTAMLEALQRRERIEPFPEYAHVEVVRLLNAAIAKSANEALISGEQSEPDEAQDQSPDSVLAEDAPESHHSQRRDFDAASAESIASNEAVRTRGEEMLRESKRHQAEMRAMRDTLAARDATIAQVLNSLGERDAQLAELQQQHAKVVSMLEARAGAGTQLGADLRALQARSATLAAELATARAALQSEQNKSRGFDKAWAESLASNEAARSRADEALLEAKRYQTDSRALRETLVAREATIAQIKRSLGERDAQLAALQQEHAKIVPMLKARADAGAQLGAELPAARMRADAIGLELKASKEAAALLSAQLTRSESGLNDTVELSAGVVAESGLAARLRSEPVRRIGCAGPSRRGGTRNGRSAGARRRNWRPRGKRSPGTPARPTMDFDRSSRDGGRGRCGNGSGRLVFGAACVSAQGSTDSRGRSSSGAGHGNSGLPNLSCHGGVAPGAIQTRVAARGGRRDGVRNAAALGSHRPFVEHVVECRYGGRLPTIHRGHRFGHARLRYLRRRLEAPARQQLEKSGVFADRNAPRDLCVVE
jgi:hypothetical protein